MTGSVNPSGAGTLTLSPAAIEVEGGRSWYGLNQAVTATAAPAMRRMPLRVGRGVRDAGFGAGAGGAVGTLVMERAEVGDGELQCGVHGDECIRGVVGDGGLVRRTRRRRLWLGSRVESSGYVFSLVTDEGWERRGRGMSFRSWSEGQARSIG